jgi:hypothetical protein
MLPLPIKRQHDTTVDPKQVLRAHIDQLSADKQREFVASAFQLIAARTAKREAARGASTSAYKSQ